MVCVYECVWCVSVYVCSVGVNVCEHVCVCGVCVVFVCVVCGFVVFLSGSQRFC